jgi:hypothetical protein
MTSSYMAKSDRSRFQLDEDGISNPLWAIGTLQWKEVREVFIKRDGGREFVCIVVRDRQALNSRLGFLRRIFNSATQATGFGDLTIDVARAGVRAEDIIGFSATRIAAQK